MGGCMACASSTRLANAIPSCKSVYFPHPHIWPHPRSQRQYWNKVAGYLLPSHRQTQVFWLAWIVAAISVSLHFNAISLAMSLVN